MRLGLVVVVGLVLATSAIAEAPTGTSGKSPRGLWIEQLRQPSGVSCCSESDCRVARAKFEPDGFWWVEVGGGDDNWIRVPKEKVIEADSFDGAAYICRNGRTIYCFVKPGSGG